MRRPAIAPGIRGNDRKALRQLIMNPLCVKPSPEIGGREPVANAACEIQI
jgi:hypothetical protein